MQKRIAVRTARQTLTEHVLWENPNVGEEVLISNTYHHTCPLGYSLLWNRGPTSDRAFGLVPMGFVDTKH